MELAESESEQHSTARSRQPSAITIGAPFADVATPSCGDACRRRREPFFAPPSAEPAVVHSCAAPYFPLSPSDASFPRVSNRLCLLRVKQCLSAVVQRALLLHCALRGLLLFDSGVHGILPEQRHARRPVVAPRAWLADTCCCCWGAAGASPSAMDGAATMGSGGGRPRGLTLPAQPCLSG